MYRVHSMTCLGDLLERIAIYSFFQTWMKYILSTFYLPGHVVATSGITVKQREQLSWKDHHWMCHCKRKDNYKGEVKCMPAAMIDTLVPRPYAPQPSLGKPRAAFCRHLWRFLWPTGDKGMEAVNAGIQCLGNSPQPMTKGNSLPSFLALWERASESVLCCVPEFSRKPSPSYPSPGYCSFLHPELASFSSSSRLHFPTIAFWDYLPNKVLALRFYCWGNSTNEYSREAWPIPGGPGSRRALSVMMGAAS